MKMHIGVLSNIFKEHTENKEVENDLYEIGTSVKNALDSSGHKTTFFDANRNTFKQLKDKKIDVAFNVCERFENDAHKEPYIAEMLEKIKIPFTGSSSSTISLCNNKYRIKKLLVKHKIPTPKFQIFKKGDEKISNDIHFPLIVKPTLEHNSIGLNQDSIVNSKEKLKEKIKNIIDNFNQPCLVEEFIKGKDIEVGIIGNKNKLEVLPLAEVGYKNFKGNKNGLIFSYEEKWDKNLDTYGDYVFPNDIPKEVELEMKKISEYLYNLVGLRDYGRIDFRLSEDNIPYVLEICVNPGLSEVCSMPEAYEHMGLKYDDLINKILNHALERYNGEIKKSVIIEN